LTLSSIKKENGRTGKLLNLIEMFRGFGLDLFCFRICHHHVHQHLIVFPQILLIIWRHLLGLILSLLEEDLSQADRLWLVTLLLLDNTLKLEWHWWLLAEFFMHSLDNLCQRRLISPVRENWSLVVEGMWLNVGMRDLTHDLNAWLRDWEVDTQYPKEDDQNHASRMIERLFIDLRSPLPMNEV
jgi:hypothetical protein